MLPPDLAELLQVLPERLAALSWFGPKALPVLEPAQAQASMQP